jgi:hypothetical protein
MEWIHWETHHPVGSWVISSWTWWVPWLPPCACALHYFQGVPCSHWPSSSSPEGSVKLLSLGIRFYGSVGVHALSGPPLSWVPSKSSLIDKAKWQQSNESQPGLWFPGNSPQGCTGHELKLTAGDRISCLIWFLSSYLNVVHWSSSSLSPSLNSNNLRRIETKEKFFDCLVPDDLIFPSCCLFIKNQNNVRERSHLWFWPSPKTWIYTKKEIY